MCCDDSVEASEDCSGGRDDLGGWLAGTLSGVAFRAQPTLELFLRTGASMRFHPKSRASTDQRPGPNIASAAANGCLPTGRPMDVRPTLRIVGDLDHGDDRSRHGRP